MSHHSNRKAKIPSPLCIFNFSSFYFLNCRPEGGGGGGCVLPNCMRFKAALTSCYAWHVMHSQLSCVCLLPEPSTFLALSTLTLNAVVLPVKILVKLAFWDQEIIGCGSWSADVIRYRIMDPILLDFIYFWLRPIRVVRASDSLCRSHNCLGFDPSILRHSGIWGAAEKAVLNKVLLLDFRIFSQKTVSIFLHNKLVSWFITL
jgi:hypothetical protein